MKKIVCVLLALAALSAPGVFAYETIPYDTYTYSYDGETIRSPHAYLPGAVYSAASSAGRMSEPGDLFAAQDGTLYVADTGNNRIVIFDAQGGTKATVGPFTFDGVEQNFAKPGGLFVTQDGALYVADTDNQRIVVFDRALQCVKIIGKPEHASLPEDFSFIPSKIVLDSAGRIYCVSKGNIYGIVALDTEGGFETFVGAQQVAPDLMERFWRMFMTREQKMRSEKIVPSNYNNICIDEKGFLYATSTSSETAEVIASIRSRSTDNRYAPIKKLNPRGEDVLRRTGFFPPAGDVKITVAPRGSMAAVETAYGPSYIYDVALGQDGVYSLMDQKRGKIFTYDSDGNLLYVFGDTGYQPGQFQKLSSIAYGGGYLFALDETAGTVTRFDMTPYGQRIAEAIHLTEARDYDGAVTVFEQILRENNGFDLANIGIGNAMMRKTQFREAMSYYQNANDVANYSKAFGLYRKGVLGNFILLIPVAIAVLSILIMLFFKYAKQYNLRVTHEKPDRRTVRQELMYGFHVIFRPFDGFWDLKREKRGGVRGASIILAFTIASMLFQQLATGYIVTGEKTVSFNPLVSVATYLGVVLLWCTANWGLTSLMSGEGTYRDIYVATCYSLLPVGLFVIPATILSNVVTQQEIMFVSVLTACGFIWAAFLLFAAVMTTHSYTLGKNIATILFTLVGMVLIAFLLFLFVNLIGRMAAFVENIYTEITFRM